MKIIDNKKDYYDHLVGKYGMDNKMVYDRRHSLRIRDGVLKLNSWRGFDVKTFCQMYVRIGRLVYIIEKDPHTGEWKLAENSYDKHYNKQPNPYRITTEEQMYSFVPSERKWNPKSKLFEYTYDPATPISMILHFDVGNGYSRDHIIVVNPILGSFPAIPALIPADVVWNEVYDFISASYDHEIVDNRSDVQKLQAAGFDKVTSFRNMK